MPFHPPLKYNWQFPEKPFIVLIFLQKKPVLWDEQIWDGLKHKNKAKINLSSMNALLTDRMKNSESHPLMCYSKKLQHVIILGEVNASQ